MKNLNALHSPDSYRIVLFLDCSLDKSGHIRDISGQVHDILGQVENTSIFELPLDLTKMKDCSCCPHNYREKFIPYCQDSNPEEFYN
jgi:hypothetical protein